MSKAKLYMLRVGFFLIFFPVALAFPELSIRFFNLREVGQPRDDAIEAPYMPLRLRPNYKGTVVGVPFSTNEYGFRDSNRLSLTPQPGEYRILSLGDSIGLGLGLESSEHYTQVLEDGLALQSDSRRVRVINAAGQGYSPSSYYVYMRQEGNRFQPDLVLVEIELNNDVTDEALLHWQTENGLPAAVRGGRYVIGWDGNLLGTFAVKPYWFERTYTYTLLLRKTLRTLDRMYPASFIRQPGVTYFFQDYEAFLLDEEQLEEGWHRLFGALEGLQSLLDQQGVPLLVMILPSRYMFEEGAPLHNAFANSLYERALQMARQKGLSYVGFKDVLSSSGGERLYFDFAHPTAEGNQAIGEELVRRLISEGPPPFAGSRQHQPDRLQVLGTDPPGGDLPAGDLFQMHQDVHQSKGVDQSGRNQCSIFIDLDFGLGKDVSFQKPDHLFGLITHAAGAPLSRIADFP